MLDKYYFDECNGDINRIKIPSFGEYLRSNGYPDIQDYTLRRSAVLKARIKEFAEEAQKSGQYVAKSAVFANLDIDAFLKKNNTEEKLRTALQQRDKYYEYVSQSIQYYLNNNSNLKSENKSLNNTIKEMTDKADKAEKALKELRKSNNQLQKKCDEQKAYIDAYINPDIATMLLQETNNPEVKGKSSKYIDKEKAAKNILRADDENPYSDNVVRGLFDNFDMSSNRS